MVKRFNSIFTKVLSGLNVITCFVHSWSLQVGTPLSSASSVSGFSESPLKFLCDGTYIRTLNFFSYHVITLKMQQHTAKARSKRLWQLSLRIWFGNFAYPGIGKSLEDHSLHANHLGNEFIERIFGTEIIPQSVHHRLKHKKNNKFVKQMINETV